jgi:hypothetical protein
MRNKKYEAPNKQNTVFRIMVILIGILGYKKGMVHMQYFVGVVPPEEYLKRVVAFQKRWTTNRLPEVVEPHMTVKAQDGLTEDMNWLNKF